MTIRQQGGVFGRNPKFNDVEASSVTISSENNPVLLAERTANTADIDLVDPQSTARIRNVAGRVQFYADANDERADSGFRFYIDNLRKVDIDTNGNIVFANSGNGIDFSATSGTGTSELFDDYEEGTWTPVLTAYNGTPTVSGYYVKIGQMVYVECSVALDGTSDASSYIIENLPFTMSSPQLGGGAINRNTGGVADVTVSSDPSGRLRLYNSSSVNYTYTALGVSSTITLNAQYRAA